MAIACSKVNCQYFAVEEHLCTFHYFFSGKEIIDKYKPQYKKFMKLYNDEKKFKQDHKVIEFTQEYVKKELWHPEGLQSVFIIVTIFENLPKIYSKELAEFAFSHTDPYDLYRYYEKNYFIFPFKWMQCDGKAGCEIFTIMGENSKKPALVYPL
jgi:hypothetical protein